VALQLRPLDRGSLYRRCRTEPFRICTGRIWGASQDANGLWVGEELLDTELQITAFGEDEGGEIYLASFGPNAGAIFRISEVPASSPTDPGSPPPTGTESGGDGGGGGDCFIASSAD
jgi:hypothetical protein